MDNRLNLSASILWIGFGNEAIIVIQDCRWQIMLCVIAIIADLWWAYSEHKYHVSKLPPEAQKKEREKWRKSKAIRKSSVKLVDYMSLLLIGMVLGLAFCEPYDIANHTQCAACGVIIGVASDLLSCIGHFCVVREITISRKSVSKFLVAFIKKKNEDIGEALEETINQEGTEK